MKRSLFILKLWVLLIVASAPSYCQISGPSTVTVGSSHTYSYNNGMVFGPSWYLNIPRGTITSQWQSGSTYYCSITWNSIGSDDIVFFDMGQPLAQMNINITAAPPSAPTANTASAISSNSFTANWSSVSGATNYRLFVSTVSNFSSHVSGFNNLYVTGTSKSVTGLQGNTTYFYRLKAQNSGGTSAYSNTKSLVTAPASPTAAAATQVGHDSFLASWNSVPGATSYRLDVSTVSNFSSYVGQYHDYYVSETSSTVFPLSGNQTYHYRVRAVGSSGTSTNSNTITLTTLPTPPSVSAATGVTANSFTANWGSVSGATQYLLDVSIVANFSSFLPGFHDLALATTSANISTGISAGTTYYYRVRAQNSGWTTGYSSIIQVLTIPPPPNPYAATGMTATSFTANWTSALGATSYRLDVSTSDVFASFVSGFSNRSVSGLSESVTGLAAGSTYYYRLRAVNSSGTSVNSPAFAAITILPPPVANSAANITSSSFTANWSALPGASSYRLDVSPVSNFSSFVSGFNNISLTGTGKFVPALEPGKNYYYRVRAVNGSGTSANSGTITVSTLLVPVVAVTSTNVTSSSFTANWNSSTNATSYRLDVSTKSDFTTFVSGYNNLSVTGTSKNVTGLLAKTTYYYRVRAVNGTGTSLNSNTIVGVDLNQNYIRTIDVTVPGKTTAAHVENATINERITNYSFFDGLGRPIQSVTQQGSPSEKDVIQPIAYDPFGRETKKYLPYTDENTGWYKGNSLRLPDATGTEQVQYMTGKQYAFYQLGGVLASDQFPYAETRFESSPLNRILEQGSPGASWQPDQTDSYTSVDRTIKSAYESNEVQKVLKWTYSYPTGTFVMGLVNAGTAASPVYYDPKELYRNSTKDEQHNEVIEYKNKLGKVILKRVQAVAGSPTENDTNYASTYYEYDDFGNLVCVIPPEAVARLATEFYQPGATDNTKDAFLKRWAFRYAYDSRKRMILKQVPGMDPVYMVYDRRDRLVMTQDGNQRSGATKYWTFTKYDHLNRPVVTGIYTSSNTLAQMQTAVDAYYANLSGSQAWFESYVGDVAGNAHGYDKASFPQTGITGYLTATYYDRYEFRSTWAGSYDYENDGLSQTLNGVSYSQPAGENPRVNGLVTGAKVRVLDGGVAGGYTWLKSVSYYDDDQRLIQVIAENYKGGTDRTSSLYDFTGRVLKTRTTHIGRDITWTAKVGVKEEGNKLIRTVAGGSWGAAGAVSVQKLAAGTDGWMEIVASENTLLDRMIGFSDQNTNNHYNSLDYAWHLSNDGTVRIWESNVARGNFGPFSPGTILKIERVGSSMKYYMNNVLKRTVTAASTPALMVDAALHTLNTTVTNVRSSFSTSIRTINRRYVYDHGGRLTHTWHQVDSQPEILLAYNEYNELGQLVDKRLHSTATDGSDALQSVDYRYNIRGWMTSINNAELAVDAGTNDEAGDYFGMNLAYEGALGTGNTGQYNGNISGASWSVNQGFGTIKAMAYNFLYDPMNRLGTATNKQAMTLGTWTTGQYDENGLTYDLNGNIRTLQRKGADGTIIDDLDYYYETTTEMTGNKLYYITDGAAVPDKAKGFSDGNSGEDDYNYDANGNMITDKNKGITSNITYNYLNLPELVARGGNTVRYIYDATGRKLAQQVTFSGSTRRTDYAGEFIYESDILQTINHEEGRIVVSGERLLLADGCDNTGNMTASNATLATHSANGEQYVKVTANGATAKTGIFPIGGSFTVAPGERYRIRAKGYRTGANAVYLLIKANTTDLDWPGAALPGSSSTEAWIEQIVTIPAGTSNLQVGVTWNTVTAGQIFYLNEFVIEQLTTVAPEYQYHLKDHLGNVRVTFTSKDEIETYTATLEDNSQTPEQATFNNYSRVAADIYDHTDAGTTYDKAQVLNGGNNSQVGLTKSLAVMPGDTVTAQVYAKYFESTGGSGNLSGFAAALLSAFGLPAPGGGEAGTAAAAIQDYGIFIAGGGNSGTSGWPKGWLNMLIFDKDFNLIDLAYEQLDEAYMQPVGNVNKLPMQLLSVGKRIKEPGYVYIYISNEGSVQQDIYFDDLAIVHEKSRVIQGNDYYPFGLTFNSYQRENSTADRKRFQSQEHIEELGLNWDSFKWRNYQPDIGRFFNIDPLAEKYVHNGTYAFAENKVITFRELEGLEGVHYMEGSNHVIEKNVMVLLKPKKEIPKDADAKTVKKLERQNSRIARQNVAKLASVTSELNTFFNGVHGKGTKNSKGENVVFRFNVSGGNDSGKEAKKIALSDRNAYYKALGISNGLFGTSRVNPLKATLIAPAAVLTTESPTKGDFGDTSGAIAIRMSSRSPEGGLSHEVLHSLGLPDNGYNKGGLLNSPPQSISSSEVDEAIRLSYDKQ